MRSRRGRPHRHQGSARGWNARGGPCDDTSSGRAQGGGCDTSAAGGCPDLAQRHATGGPLDRAHRRGMIPSRVDMIGKKLGAAAVILDTLGRVLLVKHTYGPLNWELPGGGAEE